MANGPKSGPAPPPDNSGEYQEYSTFSAVVGSGERPRLPGGGSIPNARPPERWVCRGGPMWPPCPLWLSLAEQGIGQARGACLYSPCGFVRHSGESRNPFLRLLPFTRIPTHRRGMKCGHVFTRTRKWIPAFTGMTAVKAVRELWDNPSDDSALPKRWRGWRCSWRRFTRATSRERRST